jgi:hypothetical protein
MKRLFIGLLLMLIIFQKIHAQSSYSFTLMGDLAYGGGTWTAQGTLVQTNDGLAITMDVTLTLPDADLTLPYQFGAEVFLRPLYDAQGIATPSRQNPLIQDGLPVLGYALSDVSLGNVQTGFFTVDNESQTIEFRLTFDEATLPNLPTGTYGLAWRGFARVGDSENFDWYANRIFSTLGTGADDATFSVILSDAQITIGDDAQTPRLTPLMTQTPLGTIALNSVESASDVLPSVWQNKLANYALNDQMIVHGRRGVLGYTRRPQAWFDTLVYPLDAPLEPFVINFPFFGGDILTIPNAENFAIQPIITLEDSDGAYTAWLRQNHPTITTPEGDLDELVLRGSLPLIYPDSYALITVVRANGDIMAQFIQGDGDNGAIAPITTQDLAEGEVLFLFATVIIEKPQRQYQDYVAIALITDGTTAQVQPPLSALSIKDSIAYWQAYAQQTTQEN